MSIRKVSRSDWFSFFDHNGTLLVGKQVEVEVASLALGSQIVARALPLLGMVYDPRSDVLEILLDGLDHLVQHPREIYVDDPPFAAMSMAVTDGDGVLQIITLRDPLMLTAVTG